MAFQLPKPGTVIRYAYLWREEAARGQEEGLKDRPAVVVLTTQTDDGQHRVMVVPITHSPPSDPDRAVEVSAETARRLGLDDGRQWIITAECNYFAWPGPDLRFVRGKEPPTADLGFLGSKLAHKVLDKVRSEGRLRTLGMVPRTE
ncbi:MAG: hypothetical protein AAFV45_10985 [Pseudomonadota bacterium]